METNDDILRRLSRLEKSDDDMRDALQQLVISTTKLNEVVSQLSRLEPVVQDLQMKQMNNTMVIQAVKWASLAFIGSAISIITTLFIKGLV